MLCAILGIEHKKVTDAITNSANSKMKEKDAALEQHTQDVLAQIEKDRQQAEADKEKTLTKEQILDFINKSRDHK